jgi:uncharacterized RDD family membrane protein YckC
MTQQEDMTGQEPGASRSAANGAGPEPRSGVPAAPPADPAAGQAEPVWPSPYLSQGQSVPEAYPAPAQPGQPSYGAPAGSARPGPPLGAGSAGYAQPGSGQPDTGTPGFHPAYQQRDYGQPRRPMGRMGYGGRAVARDPALAAAWERLLAMTMDWLLILVVAFLALLSPMLRLWHQLETVLTNSQALSQSAAQTALNNVLQSPATTSTLTRFWLVAFGIALAYFWALPAVWGLTVGKQVLGLRVVAADSRAAISVRTAGLRAVAFLAGPAIFLLAPDIGLLGGLLWVADCTIMLLDGRRQCLHDRVAGTAVIRKRWLDQQARPAQPAPW